MSTRREGECHYGVFNGKRTDLMHPSFYLPDKPVYENEILCSGQELHECDDNKAKCTDINNFYKNG